MARLRTSLFLLLGCVLFQRAFTEPRPEFGSAGTVQSSLTIKNTANSITPLLDALDDKNTLVLKTDYSVLVQVLPLMKSLGTQVATLGPPITNAIVTGVPKSDGNYDAVFNPVVSAIDAMQNFIDTEQKNTRSTLKTMLGDDIDHLFGDAFGNMALALSQVKSTLLRLKGALKTAKLANGRAQVDPSIVTDVVAAVSYFKATISPVEFTVQSTIDNIEFADYFLFDLEDMNNVLKGNLVTYTKDFSDAINNDADLVKSAVQQMEDTFKPTNDGLAAATSNVASSTEYTNGAAKAVQSFQTGFSTLTTFRTNLPKAVTDYLAATNTYFTQYTDILVPRSYEAITFLIKVLVAGGPYSRFCFFKFSPRLINYYALLVNDVERCYNQESFRLSYMYDVATAVGKLILFDVEDLIDNLTACNGKSSPGPCLTAIGPYYIALADKTKAKIASFTAYVGYETTASVKRLGSCIVTSKLHNMHTLTTAVSQVQQCHDQGPQAP